MQVTPVRLLTLSEKAPQWSLLPHQHLQSPPVFQRHWAARAPCQLVQPPPIRRCLWTSQNRWGVRISLDATEPWKFGCCSSVLPLFQMVNQRFALVGLWTALQYMKWVMVPTCGPWLDCNTLRSKVVKVNLGIPRLHLPLSVIETPIWVWLLVWRTCFNIQGDLIYHLSFAKLLLF